MDINSTVSQNIKRLRERRKLTLDAAAAATGVSRSMLAQIERGDVNPTISVLWKIANGYRVSFTTLTEPEEPAALIRAGDPLLADEGRYRNYPAFPFAADRQFETYRILIAPGGKLEAQPHLANSQEYLTVFHGRVEVRAGTETFVLEAGDSLRFQADQSHAYANLADEQAEMSMLIYYGE